MKKIIPSIAVYFIKALDLVGLKPFSSMYSELTVAEIKFKL